MLRATARRVSVQLAIAASVLIAVASTIAAPVSAAETPPVTEPAACVQPVASFAMIKPTGADGVLRLTGVPGPVNIANGATITLKSDPSVSKGVQISARDGNVTIVAEQLNVRKIAGKQYAFLYDRTGERCAFDQLPKELQFEV
jgi:hypothetical protein